MSDQRSPQDTAAARSLARYARRAPRATVAAPPVVEPLSAAERADSAARLDWALSLASNPPPPELMDLARQVLDGTAEIADYTRALEATR